jgi:histone H3/H4
MFLASQGGGRKGDLSRFIEEAVRNYIFERAVEDAKAVNANVSEADLSSIVNEAVQWARSY